VGLIPVAGEAANAIGALVYLAEGDKISAAMDFAAMWPAGGQAATAAKYGRKAVGVAVEQAEKAAAKETAEAAAKRLAKEAEEASAKKAAKEAEEKAAKGGYVEGPKESIPNKDPRYKRGKFRKGVREKVWEDAKGSDGKVRNPLTDKEMNPNEPWDMGHKPGYEHRKHQESASVRNISRKDFLNEYNDPSKYRPELPSSNRSHAGEIKTSDYFGD